MDRPELIKEREKTHGSFKVNAAIWDAYCKHVPSNFGNPEQRLAISMIFLKLSRALQNPTEKDHWNDIAGYAQLASEACDAPKRNA